jgi:metal-dependent amidase/aminoacylase/carboxypeptidase family protein
MKQWSEQLGIGPHLDAFVALRRDLHAHPELAFQEQRTAQRIAAWLQAGRNRYRWHRRSGRANARHKPALDWPARRHGRLTHPGIK